MRLLLAATLSALQRDGREGIGLDTQDTRSREWAEREGHAVVGIAADTKSGTVAPWDRKHLKPWVTDPAKLTLYDGVLAYKTDRVSRGTQEDFTRIEHWATEHGKKIIIVDGPQYPARDDSDYWRWAAEKRTARVEWENGRERTVRAHDALRERGKLVGKPPWGYVPVGEKYSRTIVPTDEARRLVPEVFARCIAGDSLATLARWLTRESGRRWWPQRVAAMLRCRTYAGHRCDSEGRTLLRCEALVDAATFRRAGEALSAHPKRGPSNTAGRAMLATALYCPRCDDSPMYRVSTRTGVYYRCYGRGAARKGCGNIVLVEVADAAVNKIAAMTFSRPVMVRKVTPGRDYSAELEEVRFEMRQLAMREDLTDAQHDADLARLRAERDRLAALPSEPDRIEEVPTGQTYAGLWSALDPAERGPWLARQGFRVTADKTSVTLAQGTTRAPLALGEGQS